MKADKLLTGVLSEMQRLDADQMNDFVVLMTSTMISVMRGIHGDEFVSDFLKAAIDDKNPPVITPCLRQ